MNENLFISSVDAAVSAGDVDRLVYLWKDSDNEVERQDYIDSLIPEVAGVLGLPSRDTLKEFVVEVYDPVQAYKALISGTAIKYLQNGGIARYRNIARFFSKVLCNKNEDVNTRYLGEVLYYLLLVLEDDYYIKELIEMNRTNGTPGCFDRLRECTDIVLRLSANKGNWKAYVNLLSYDPDDELLATGGGNIRRHPIIILPEFFKAYAEKFYPKIGPAVISKLLKYITSLPLGEGGGSSAAPIINAITNLGRSREEKDEILEYLKRLMKPGYLRFIANQIKDEYISSQLKAL